MSNIFKNDRNIKKNIHYLSPSNNQNSFKPNNEKKQPNFEMNESQFPELSATDSGGIRSENENENENEGDRLNYKEAASKEIPEDELKNDDELLLPGWVRYHRNKNNGEIMVDENCEEEDDEEDAETPEEFHNRVYNTMQSIIDRWENYKTDYDNLYGEGEYDRQYCMPNYESSITDDEFD